MRQLERRRRRAGGSSGTPAAGGGNADTVILGTTDKVVALDPVGAYDLGSQQLIGNMYQNLLSIPAGGNKPEPDAAESCEFSDPKTYICKLKPDLKFSSGDPLTSEDVKFSLDRMVKIEDPTRSVHAAGSLKSVEATDPTTVTMKLKKADAHVARSSSPTTSPRSCRTRSTRPTPSSPTTRRSARARTSSTSTRPNQQAVFSANPNYNGPNKAQTPNFIVQYFDQASALKLAIEQGDVDVAYRSLSPTDLEALKTAGKGVKVVDGAGTEIRYIVFNVKKKPVDNVAVRKAVAQIIDRHAIATNVYKGTVKPLYSTVPAAFPGAKESFKDAFGDPDPAKAKAILDEAGVKTPVDARRLVHADPLRAGRGRSLERDQASARGERPVQGQPRLDRVGPVQGRGLRQGHVLLLRPRLVPGLPGRRQLPHAVHARRWLLRQRLLEQGSQRRARHGDRAPTTRPSARRRSAIVQDDEAADVPLIPLWEGKQIAAIRDGVEGVEKTFDPAFQFRFWLVTKKES